MEEAAPALPAWLSPCRLWKLFRFRLCSLLLLVFLENGRVYPTGNTGIVFARPPFPYHWFEQEYGLPCGVAELCKEGFEPLYITPV